MICLKKNPGCHPSVGKGTMREVWRDIPDALGTKRFTRAFDDGWVWLALLLGFIGLPFAPGPMPPLWRMGFAAVAEELAYRALVQQQLEQCTRQRRGPFTCGGAIASVLFALSHLPTHSPLMALLTFFPSLFLGVLWTRHRSLWLCAAVHFWYNLLFFL